MKTVSCCCNLKQTEFPRSRRVCSIFFETKKADQPRAVVHAAGPPITQLRLGHRNVEVTLKIDQKLPQGLAEQGTVALAQIFKTTE